MKQAGRRSDLPRNLSLRSPQLGRNEYKWLDEKEIYSKQVQQEFSFHGNFLLIF